MKRTVLMIAVGITAAMTLAAVIPASADLFSGMPSMGVMGTYNQIMRQYGGGARGGGLMMGMPTTNIMQDYNRLLPQLRALQAWGHANGMPYARPGTLGGGFNAMNGAAAARNGATRYWGNKFSEEFLREQIPIYEDNAGHYTRYGNGDTATE